MSYEKINIERELRKVTQGKSNRDAGFVALILHSSLGHYPAIQKKIAKAFGITVYRPRTARKAA